MQYHALQGVQSKDQYASDAAEHSDVAEFFTECARHDAWRAQRCQELLAKLTADSGIGSS